VLAEYGHVYDQELRSHVIGRGEVEGANLIINTKSLPLGPHEFLEKREVHLKELFPTAEPMPGTLAGVDRIQQLLETSLN